MSFREFTLADLKHRFGIRLEERADFFAGISPVPISEVLRESLLESLPLALAISTEKARSEMIIAPVLIEVRRQCQRRISLFSGIEFSVAPEQGLTGVCDFLFSATPEQLSLEAPIVAVVEAKNENIKQGIAQCISELLAAQLFNQQHQNPIEPLYGVVTTGSNWKFLQLTETLVQVDQLEYYIREVERIVGILLAMVRPKTPR